MDSLEWASPSRKAKMHNRAARRRALNKRARKALKQQLRYLVSDKEDSNMTKIARTVATWGRYASRVVPFGFESAAIADLKRKLAAAGIELAADYQIKIA